MVGLNLLLQDLLVYQCIIETLKRHLVTPKRKSAINNSVHLDMIQVSYRAAQVTQYSVLWPLIPCTHAHCVGVGFL